ncbi:MAG: KH domain-containing protein [Deltaproteobacteria bacterium]|nr:KH domain-containing protein [Deltaproteobacteria bacterium]
MEALTLHLARHIVSHPEDLRVQEISGEASVVVELVVHPEDEARVRGENDRTLRAMSNILSAAAGRRKATLDLVPPDAFGAEE